MGKFIIHSSDDGQYYFTLVASNGQVIVTRETYTTKQSCKKGIKITKTYASLARVSDKS